MFFKSKKIWFVCACAFLASCSSSKEIPQGHRVSVLDVPEKIVFKKTNPDLFNLSKPEEIATWSQIGSNSAHLSKNISALMNKKQWKENFGDGADKRNLLLAIPVVSNGVIYTQDVKGTVKAFNLENGEEVFSQKLKPLNKNDSSSSLNGAGIALDQSKIYALTGFGSVFALDQKTGEILWRKDLNIPLRSSPTVFGKMLFVQTIDNQLFNLDTTDGSETWNYGIFAEDTVLAGGAAPAYSKEYDTVVAAFSNGEIQAFNASIGYPLWSNNLINTERFSSSSPINAVKASPVIDGQTVYAVGNNDKTLAIDIKNGDVLWQRQIGGVNMPLVDVEAIFIVSNNYELIALDKKTGETLWQKQLLENLKAKERRKLYLSGPLLVNSELVVTTSSGLVLTFDAKTGEQKSFVDLDEDLPFAPIFADNNTIFTTNNAKLIVYK